MKDVSILEQNGVNVKKSLELFGDMGTYDQMLEEFLMEVDNKINNARKFKDNGDMPNYAIVVHSLKSDSRYFGMEALGDMFYEHELAGKRNDLIFVNNNFDALISEANRMINILKRYMGVEVSEEAPVQSTPVAPVSTQTISAPLPSSGRETILVVDDSNIIRNFIQKIFEDKYDVKLANDGEEAISIVSNTPHSDLVCVFLDLNMPNVDGFQVLDYFKANNLFKVIPVSIITGVDDKESVNRAFSYPIVDMIQKPFNEASIRNVAMKTVSMKNM